MVLNAGDDGCCVRRVNNYSLEKCDYFANFPLKNVIFLVFINQNYLIRDFMFLYNLEEAQSASPWIVATFLPFLSIITV